MMTRTWKSRQYFKESRNWKRSMRKEKRISHSLSTCQPQDGQSSADETPPEPSFSKIQIRRRGTGIRRVGTLRDLTNALPSSSTSGEDLTPAPVIPSLPTPPPSSELGDEPSSRSLPPRNCKRTIRMFCIHPLRLFHLSSLLLYLCR